MHRALQGPRASADGGTQKRAVPVVWDGAGAKRGRCPRQGGCMDAERVVTRGQLERLRTYGQAQLGGPDAAAWAERLALVEQLRSDLGDGPKLPRAPLMSEKAQRVAD